MNAKTSNNNKLYANFPVVQREHINKFFYVPISDHVVCLVAWCIQQNRSCFVNIYIHRDKLWQIDLIAFYIFVASAALFPPLFLSPPLSLSLWILHGNLFQYILQFAMAVRSVLLVSFSIDSFFCPRYMDLICLRLYSSPPSLSYVACRMRCTSL